MGMNLLEKLPKKSDLKFGVYVDGLRTPTETPEGYTWFIVRNYEEFTDLVTQYYRTFKKMPELFSFEHDLTPEYVEWRFMNPGLKIVEYSSFKTKSGLHCAKWLTEACDKNGVSLESTLFASHSQNDQGRSVILDYLNKYKRDKWGPAKANAFEKNWRYKYEDDGDEEIPQERSGRLTLLD